MQTCNTVVGIVCLRLPVVLVVGSLATAAAWAANRHSAVDMEGSEQVLVSKKGCL